MATKTISIEIDVYDRLKALKQTSSESFSQVLRRELSPPRGISAKDLLRIANEEGGVLKITEAQLQEIEQAKESLNLWSDPWNSWPTLASSSTCSARNSRQ
jgi:predicted CopG family antitoxin